MTSEWFYGSGGEACGPVSSSELKTMAASGEIGPDTLIWREGCADWVRASTTQGLFPQLSPPRSSPPPLLDSESATAFDQTIIEQEEQPNLPEDSGLTTEVTETKRTPFWGIAKQALGNASARVSTTGMVVASKAASLGTSGAAKAVELGKQTYVAAGNAVEASGATQAIKATAGAVAGKLDEVSGKRLVELLEQKLRVQDSYNDVLATRLADAIERISILEDRLNELSGTEVKDEDR